MIRKIDDLGRIVIPKEMRKELNINTNDKLKIMTDGNKIILSKEFNTVDEIQKEIERLQKLLEEFNNNRQNNLEMGLTAEQAAKNLIAFQDKVRKYNKIIKD